MSASRVLNSVGLIRLQLPATNIQFRRYGSPLRSRLNFLRLNSLTPRFHSLRHRTQNDILRTPLSHLSQYRNVGTNTPMASIAKAEVECEYITVTWSDGTQDKYPIIFLRDCCQCSECYNVGSQSRQLHMNDLDIEVQANNVTVVDDSMILIEWSDHHQSYFDAQWLKERSFQPEKQNKRLYVYGEEKLLWNKDLSQKIPRYSFAEIMAKKCSLLNWLTDVDRFGLTIVYDVPLNENQLPLLSQTVAPIKPTYYGGFFKVKYRNSNVSNLSFTGGPLPLHVDLASLEYNPQIQFLQCIENSCEGGESIFADALYAADYMKKNHRVEYDLLTTTLVDFKDVGVEGTSQFNMAFRHPTISLDVNGDFQCVYFSQHLRAYMLNLPLETITPLYRALKRFNDVMYDNSVLYKLKPGEMAVIDNKRLVHGRTAYSVATGGGRLLAGTYMGWDDVHSKIRILKEELQ